MSYRILDSSNKMDEISLIWCNLLETSQYSFFLSWPWVSTWLKLLINEKIYIQLVVIYDNEQPVACFFIKKKKSIKLIGGVNRSYYFNTTGIEYYDEISVEYNSILMTDGQYIKYIISIFKDNIYNWNKLFFQGFNCGLNKYQDTLLSSYKVNEKSKISCFVDLTKIKNTDYLNLLSANTRYQIKRSIKEYKKIGSIEVIHASNLNEAYEMYEKLKVLHQKAWIKRGKKGSFSNKFLDKFHMNLLKNYFLQGYIQLVHILSGEETIGILYNFVYENKVYCYQSGFHYKEDNHFRPGLVSHYYSIISNYRKSNTTYDFLVGDARYKKSLSTDYNLLYWSEVQKKEFYFFIENKIRNSIYLFIKSGRC